MKADKADKIIKKAELKAKKAAQQVEVANRKAEATRQKRAAQAQKKAAKVANAATKKAAAKTKKAEAVAKKAQLAAQKAEAKKAKALEKAAAKAAEAPGGGGEGGEGAAAAPKKKSKKKLLMIAAPVLAVAVGAGVYFFVLRGGGDEEEEGPPEPIAIPVEYVFPVSEEIEEHIIALPVWGEEVLVYREELVPEPPAEPEAGESDDAVTLSDKDEAESGEEGEEGGDKGGEPAGYYPPDEDAFIKILYRYEGLQSPADLISAYTALMTTQDAGFSTVDETLLRIDPPEEFGARGTVLLARNGTEGEVQSLLLSWGGTDCSVTLDMPEGRVHDPKPETSGGIAGQPRRGLSDLEAMRPSQLGLPGDSMEAYELMPQEGSVRIAGSVCARVNIYDRGSGQIAGSYFLSNDGKLYKLEEDVNAVVELPWE